MSGRWVPPPWYGSLVMNTSPGRTVSAEASSESISPVIDPMWIGMFSACATSLPRSSNRAVEQSDRSLMFVE